MTHQDSQATPTLLDDDEEVFGTPSFEMLVRDGIPIVSGCYFMHPPLRAKSADWDAGRLVVRASDDTIWAADNVPSTGTVTACLHPVDADRLMVQLNRLVDAGNTVIVVEHTMRVVAGSDWVIDVGPGAGDQGGAVVASGPPQEVARNKTSRTAPYLKAHLS